MTTPTPDKLEIPEAAVGPASRFRKKPVVIEAVQYEYPYMDMVAEFAGPSFPVSLGEKVDGGRELYITTLEDGIGGVAKHVASPGDWIIRGVKGEIYACKPDIFEATYEPASARLPHMPDRGYAEVGELPDAVRIPLHSLTADIEYLFGRVAASSSCAPAMANSALDRLRQIEAAIRALAPPAPADNGAPATHDEESILDVISGNLRMESWVAGKTLTVMFDTESGERRFAKLRLTNIAAQPSPADLKGEPE